MPQTRIEQLDKLFAAQEAAPDLGFMTRLLALCCLPRTNPGSRHQYKRVNGPYSLYMLAGGDNKLPYGNLPRLLLVWVCREAVRTRSRQIVLGRSLSAFMRKLGIYSTSGGRHGVRTRLRNQMDRLFHAQIEMIYEDREGQQFIASRIADSGQFWWDLKRPDEPVLWNSIIVLGENLFKEIINHPVPLNINVLRALKRSSLGLDLYMWLAYRTYSLKNPLHLSWRQLYLQFGASPSKVNDKLVVNDFRKECLRELKKIKLAWPGLELGTIRGRLELRPGVPSMPPKHLRLLM